MSMNAKIYLGETVCELPWKHFLIVHVAHKNSNAKGRFVKRRHFVRGDLNQKKGSEQCVIEKPFRLQSISLHTALRFPWHLPKWDHIPPVEVQCHRDP